MTSSDMSPDGKEHNCEWEVKGVGSGDYATNPVLVLQCRICGKARTTDPTVDDEFDMYEKGVFYDGW